MITKRVVLRFPQRLVEQPIVYRLVKEYDLSFNILKAYVTPREEGLLVLELSGDNGKFEQAMQYLARVGVIVQPLSQDIKRNDARCTHCGACIAVCPTGALQLDQQTRRVNFYDYKCIACELCIRACPPRAMEVYF